MVLINYERDLSQNTTHFYLVMSIREDINNIVGYGPMTMDDIISYFYMKCVGSRNMIFKCSYKKHICMLPNKSRYKNSIVCEVDGQYYDGIIPLYETDLKFTGT